MYRFFQVQGWLFVFPKLLSESYNISKYNSFYMKSSYTFSSVERKHNNFHIFKWKFLLYKGQSFHMLSKMSPFLSYFSYRKSQHYFCGILCKRRYRNNKRLLHSCCLSITLLYQQHAWTIWDDRNAISFLSPGGSHSPLCPWLKKVTPMSNACDSGNIPPFCNDSIRSLSFCTWKCGGLLGDGE